MCMFTGVYYPRLDNPKDELCLPPKSDDFGTGNVGCGGTLSCIEKCPPLPKDVGEGGNADVDPCWQKCFVESCPAATGKLFALDACTKDKCAVECNDPSTSGCVSCATSKCSDPVTACISA